MARRPSASAKRETVRVERTYGRAEVAAALTAYVRRGSLKAAESETRIPWETIRDWKNHPRWTELYADIRKAQGEEIQAMWTAAGRDAAEGIQEAVLRCRQGLRRASLPERDAALIGRTLAGVAETAQRMAECHEVEREGITVIVHRSGGIVRPERAEDDDDACTERVIRPPRRQPTTRSGRA